MTPSTQINTSSTIDPLIQKADEVFAKTSPYEGFGFQNHCLRLFHFTSMLMAKDGVTFPSGLAYMIAMLHDLGLVSEVDQGRFYLERSLALFQRETQNVTLPNVDPEIISQCLVYNHRILPVPNLSAEADCFRRAVQIEHGHGLITYGLPRNEVQAIYKRYPRGNFDWVLLDFAKRVLTKEPKTIIDGIFF
jgi:hypothetical protein